MGLGFINGGNYQFACGTERGIGYYIMGILPLAIFAKIPSRIVFTVHFICFCNNEGITNNTIDISVDIIRIVTLPLLSKWGLSEGCSLQIKKRGVEPLVCASKSVNLREV